METNSANRQDQFKAAKEVSVMAWIENQFGDVLLLKQVRGNKSWTLPGGKVRPRETIEEALRREVDEEIGLKIQPVALLDLFDRSEKAVITFLYAARIKGHHGVMSPNDATPSLRFFWKRLREGAQGKR